MAFTQTQSGKVADGTFNSFRENGAPTFYNENSTPWTADVVESGIIFAGCILALALLAIIPGFKGVSKFYTFLWIIIGVYVGTLILLSQYSDRWESAEVEAETKYKAGTGAEIQAKIGLHIGLKGVNITLKGEPVHQLNETINYNEHFTFSTRQGRFGFGPFANNLNREFRAAQFRGLPLPILWVAEYLTIDGEGIRWGRLYRESGLYAGISLWFSLGFWILANILVFILLRYAAYMSIMTGLTMGTAVIIKHYLRNATDLVIPFSAEHKLNVHYGIMFWLVLGTGGLCVVCGALVFLVDLCWPHRAAAFFGVDVLQEERFLGNRQGSTLSTTSTSTNVTHLSSGSADTELSEVVVDRNTATPTKVKLNKVSPAPTKTIGGKLTLEADWTGESNDWEDWSDDSDMNTDDEYDDEPVKTTKTNIGRNRGFLSRFQQPRRLPSAKPRHTFTNINRRQVWQSKKGRP